MIVCALAAGYGLVASYVFGKCMQDWDRSWRWALWSAGISALWPLTLLLGVFTHFLLGY